MAQIPTYRPSPVLRTKLDVFREHINAKYKLQLTTYADLHTFSIKRMNDFWMTLWDFMEVRASVHPQMALDQTKSIDEHPSFFEGARLNFSENILCRGSQRMAVLEINEANICQPKSYSWEDLRTYVGKYANAMRASGLKRGDVIALIGSNCARSLTLLLAALSFGAIFASFATDIGAKALEDRIQQLKPRLLIAESVYSYNGKRHEISNKIDTVIQRLDRNSLLESVVIGPKTNISSKCVSFEQFLVRGAESILQFEQVHFDTPAVIMFSSGTTGAPKGIVHSHGGLTVNGLREFFLHNNLGPDDVHYQFTNIGWTLWNIAIGALFTGSAIVLYDGSPFFPSAEGFLQTIFKQRITSFGAGPRYYSELQKLNVKAKKYAHHLHSIVSTGAVLTPALAQWLAESFGAVCQLSMSGGTELAGSFLHGTRSLPSYPGELATMVLGMDIAVFSPQGEPVVEGESGELVCRRPFPNMPVMLWDDPSGNRFRDSYFSAFPGVWTHGDLVRINPRTKGIYVLGRSDGVLNPSGVRFGSSEIYNILSTPQFSNEVIDSIVVGQQRLSDEYSDATERVILFIKCATHTTTHDLLPRIELEKAIRQRIKNDLSQRHVPAFIFEIQEVPYNANGKKLEIPVKAVICGGKTATVKLKLTETELVQVKWFEKFYHIEKVLQKLRKGTWKL